MEPILDEWIDRLFGCMDEFYGERWSKTFKNDSHKDFHKTIWKNGLSGLKYDQIKRTLYYYRGQAKKESSFPPLVTEFYHYASDVPPSA